MPNFDKTRKVPGSLQVLWTHFTRSQCLDQIREAFGNSYDWVLASLDPYRVDQLVLCVHRHFNPETDGFIKQHCIEYQGDGRHAFMTPEIIQDYLKANDLPLKEDYIRSVQINEGDPILPGRI